MWRAASKKRKHLGHIHPQGFIPRFVHFLW
jgi:hypothetical protein